MRIGVVTHYWLPHRGGIEVLAGEQARRLAARGHEVRVVTSAVGAAPGRSETRYGPGRVVVERCAAWDALGERGVPWPVPGPALLRMWVRLCREVDVVLVHGCTYAHSPIVVEAARRARVPVLLLQHNPHVDYPGVIDLVERTVDRTLGRWCCMRSSAVAAVSRFTAAHVHTIAPRAEVSVIENAIDHERFVPAGAEERAEAKAALGLDGPVALSVRRLVLRNGIDWAVRMWADHGLDDTGTFVVVGDGVQRAEVEALAAGHRVRLLGAVDDDTLRLAFRAADAFIMPTRSGEGFGLAAAEAMAAGLPVVATSGGALDEVVDHGVTGAVLAPDDAAGFAAAVRALLTDPVTASRQGAAGRARVEERFTWARNIDRLEAELGALAATRR